MELGDDRVLAVLVQRCATGQDEALAQFYDATVEGVYSLTVRVLGDPELAAEVTRATYAQVWRRSAIPPPGPKRAWVHAPAHRMCVDRLRSLRHADAARAGGGDLGAVNRCELVARDRCAALSPQQQHVLSLAYFGGYDRHQIAASTGQPVTRVTYLLRSALHTLANL